MKVLLLVAPSADALTLETSNEMAHSMGFFPPLGIMYLSAYLKKYSRHTVKVIDSESEQIDYKQLESRISEFQPEVIGITTFTNTLLSVIDVLKIARRVVPKCITVLGGPHIPLYPKETMEV